MNRLYFGDNLDILKEHIPSESVDLIYLDPPFNSKQAYNLLYQTPRGKQSQAQITAFKDTWEWGEQAEREYHSVLTSSFTDVALMLKAFRQFLAETDMMAYITMMAARLIELHRVLKPTGSLFLHCDPAASHYLKIVLDAVFGKGNFRNEISWRRTPFSGSSKARAQQFPRSHDVIFFYTRSDAWTWNTPTNPYSEKYRSRFKHDDGDGRGPYRITLLKTYSRTTFDRLKAENRLVEPKKPGAKYSYKQYLSESSGGVQISDFWDDINALNPMSGERLGYPTQKPLALLERIIAACSQENDVVLDPFCGCGTTVHAAQKLRRQWIGIDRGHLAISMTEQRLRRAFPNVELRVLATSEDLEGAPDRVDSSRYPRPKAETAVVVW